MTPERKQELRECNQDKYWDGTSYSTTAVHECLDEIDRLEARQQEQNSEWFGKCARLLFEIADLRAQLAESRGPKDITLDDHGENP